MVDEGGKGGVEDGLWGKRGRGGGAMADGLF